MIKWNLKDLPLYLSGGNEDIMAEIMNKFDVAVIGGGPGGYVCAIRCSQLGARTVLVEKNDLGGTCLNRGCIPTKVFLHSAEIYEELINHGAKLGLKIPRIDIDYAAASAHKDNVIKKLRSGIAALVKGSGVALVNGEAVLTSANTFTAGGTEYTADKIIIATGGEPVVIPVPGADKDGVMDSEAFLGLTKLPESAVIIGGGVIGIEFATMLSSFGKKVTVIEMLPDIMTGMDTDVIHTMSQIMRKRGVMIHTNAKLTEIRDGMTCVFEKDGTTQKAEGEIVILAAGRRPVTGALNPGAAGIITERGFIITDDSMRTNVSDIFAIGDVTGKIALAHAASAQGLTAAANACGKNAIMQYHIVPSCVYSSPEIAAVGKTEYQLKAAGVPYQKGSFPVAANGRSTIMNCNDGFAKLLTHKRTGEILGAHIVAPRATDIIGEICVAMKAEATIEEVADTIHGHPTVSEIIMEAAHDIEGL